MKVVSKLILVFFIGLGQLTYGQKTTKYSNEFMNLGAGGRAFGMSNSVVATTKDVHSGYWNPAGLTNIKANIDLSFMHSEYFAGIANYDYLAFATKIDNKSALGVTALRFGVDGILNTLDLIQNGQIDYNRVSEFSAVDYGILLSYARKQKLRRYRHIDFSYGLNGKIIHRKVGDFGKAWGFGIDVGAQLHMGKTGWDLGLTIRDITSTFNAWSYSFTEEQEETLRATENFIPVRSLEITLPRILFGVAKTVQGDKMGLTTELDLDITTDGKRNSFIKTNLISVDPHIGFEGFYNLNEEKNKAFLRFGFGNIQKESRDSGEIRTTFMPTIGAGIQLGQVIIDYAFTDVGNASTALYSHVFSINFSIFKED